MTAGLTGGVVGATIGFVVGGPAGAQWGWVAGSVAGGMFGPHQSGPALTDLRPQASEYGRPIPIIYSVNAVGGNVIEGFDLIKTSDGDGGGKGGGGSPTGATYALNIAILICESPDGVMGLGRIWAGPEKRLIYDPTTQQLESGTLRYYDGSEDQMPDPLIESYRGVGFAPAYRGYAYIVIEGFDVSAHDGNRPPFLTIEVGRKAQVTPETLGQVFFNQVLIGSTTFVSSFHGSYYGALQHSKADMSFMHRRDILNSEFSQGLYLVWNDAADTLVRGYAGPTSDWYSTTVMGTGAYGYHTPFTVPAGDTLAGACMAQGWYCFAFKMASGGVKFRFVNPSNHTEVLGTAMEFDLSSGEQIKSIYSTDPNATWVYGVTDSKVRKYDFTLTGLVFSSQDLGVPARNTGGTSAAVDPYTGKLWTAWRDSASGNPIRWSVHDQTGLIYTGDLNPGTFYDMCRQPLTFAPDYVYICGQRWLAVDHFIRLDQDTGVLVGAPFDGVYHGVNDLHAVVYDDANTGFVGYREGGLYAITTDGSNPASLPYNSGYLGGQDSSLQYMNLAEVVTDLSLRAGLTEDQIDVTELTDQVDGYTLANQVTVQDAIKALMPAYYFDAVEDQGKIRFIKRGGDIAVEIPDDDLGAHGSGEESPGHYDTNRDDDEHLPRTFSVNYVLAATKYSPATKYARRLVGNSGDEARLEMPMVFTDQKAAEIAAVNLHDQWIGRVTYRLQLGRKYAYLMPTDLVGVQGYTMRLTKQTQKDNGVQVFEAVRDDSDTYIPNVIVEETPPPDETVDTPSLTLLELM